MSEEPIEKKKKKKKSKLPKESDDGSEVAAHVQAVHEEFSRHGDADDVEHASKKKKARVEPTPKADGDESHEGFDGIREYQAVNDDGEEKFSAETLASFQASALLQNYQPNTTNTFMHATSS